MSIARSILVVATRIAASFAVTVAVLLIVNFALWMYTGDSQFGRLTAPYYVMPIMVLSYLLIHKYVDIGVKNESE